MKAEEKVKAEEEDKEEEEIEIITIGEDTLPETDAVLSDVCVDVPAEEVLEQSVKKEPPVQLVADQVEDGGQLVHHGLRRSSRILKRAVSAFCSCNWDFTKNIPFEKKPCGHGFLVEEEVDEQEEEDNDVDEAYLDGDGNTGGGQEEPGTERSYWDFDRFTEL